MHLVEPRVENVISPKPSPRQAHGVAVATPVPVALRHEARQRKVFPAREERQTALHARLPRLGARALVQHHFRVGIYVQQVVHERHAGVVAAGSVAREEAAEKRLASRRGDLAACSAAETHPRNRWHDVGAVHAWGERRQEGPLEDVLERARCRAPLACGEDLETLAGGVGRGDLSVGDEAHSCCLVRVTWCLEREW